MMPALPSSKPSLLFIIVKSPSPDKDFQFNELPASVERLRHS